MNKKEAANIIGSILFFRESAPAETVSMFFSPEEIKEKVGKNNSLRKEQCFETIKTKPLLIKNDLSYCREKLLEEHEFKRKPSRAELCAHYIFERFCNMEIPMNPTSPSKDDVFWHDFNYGVFVAIGQILDAKKSPGNFDKRYMRSLSTYMKIVRKYFKIIGKEGEESSIFDSAPEAAESYLQTKAREMNAYHGFRKDNCGFKMLDDFIGQLKFTGQNHPEKRWPYWPYSPSNIPEFVIAGAEFTNDIYKKIYPLSKGLRKPR